jgi:hypothetical protein
MELSPTRKKRLAAAGALASVSFMVYMVSGSGPVGPPYRDENLTAGPEPLMLVRVPSVRDELKLTKAQQEQIQSALDKQSGKQSGGKQGSTAPAKKDVAPKDNPFTAPRAARMGRKHQEAFLARVLRPAQATRLRQIILQRQGGLALNDSRTAEELGLSESQRRKADEILEKLTYQLAETRNARGEDGRKKVEEVRAAAGAELLGLLTPDQENRWKEMIGEPFTGEINFGPPGGPPGGRPGGPPGDRPPGDRPPGGGPPRRAGPQPRQNTVTASP